MNKEEELITKVKSDQWSALEEIYNLYRIDFFKYAHKYNIEQEDIADIYQDCIIAFYENLKRGKFIPLNSSLKTYLFAIGKYKMLNLIKKNSSTIVFDNDLILDLSYKEDQSYDQEKMAQFEKAYQLLGKRCQKILKLFYYENLSLDEIQLHLNYSSKDVLKSQKSRCIKHIKDLINNHNE